MIITAGADGSFKMQTGGITLLTEGSEPEKSRMKPDIYLRRTAAKTETPEAGFTLRGPGEYEIKGVEIRGIAPFTYFLKAEDLRLVILSGTNIAVLDDLTNIDIALVPDSIVSEEAGPPRLARSSSGEAGEGTANIGRFLRQLEPRMIIAAPKAAAHIGKDLGIAATQTEKITVKRRDIGSTGMSLTCLTA